MTAPEPTALSVLIVDDDPATLQVIATITALGGYRVREAVDGLEAFQHILADCPDMIVTDWDMPGLDGPELCRLLRAETLPFYVYVLLLTARSGSQRMVQGLEAGADDFLSKPVHPSVFLARLKAGERTIRAERRLRALATRDPLTGATNRRSFHERFVKEWDRAARYRHPLSCAMIDLDFFKRINDAHGHAAGDAVLKRVAGLLENRCRAGDVLARYGGEEFCVLLTETDAAGAAAWAERVREAVAEEHVPFDGRVLRVSASLGVATLTADTADPEALVALADAALGAAKESGRNRVVAYDALGNGAAGAEPAGFPHSPPDHLLARDVMAPAVYVPHQDEPVGRVADMFLQLRLAAAPVVGEQSRLAGMVSETDLLATAVVSPSMDMPLRQCMKTDVVQCRDDAPAKDVFRFLSRTAAPRVVVVRDVQPVGVIGRATLLRWLRTGTRAGGTELPAAAVDSIAAQLAGTDPVADNRPTAPGIRRPRHDRDIAPLAESEAARLERWACDALARCRNRKEA